MTLNRLLFPGPTKEFVAARDTFSDLSVLNTREFLHGLAVGEEHEVQMDKGKTLLLGLTAIGDADARGMRNVMVTINGQMRTIEVRDESVKSNVAAAERADTTRPGHVPAPFAGVVTLAVGEGDEVAAGAQVATIEAMKMEAAITTPVAGRVSRLAIGATQAVEGGDLIVVVE